MNGLHELPLIIFTVLAQTAVGFWLFYALIVHFPSASADRLRWHKMAIVPLFLLAIGFGASLLHLGSPMRALNSLNRVGSSMMSNEIASGVIFFALTAAYWLMAIWGKLTASIEKVWLVIIALVGLVFMYTMANVYQIHTVPTWYTSLTSWQCYLTVLIGGAVLAQALLANRCSNLIVTVLPKVYAVAFFLAAIIVVYQGFGLAQIHSSVKQAVDLVPEYAIWQTVRLCLLAIVGVALFKLKKPFILTFAVLIVLLAEMMGRSLFYALHMTVGMH